MEYRSEVAVSMQKEDYERMVSESINTEAYDLIKYATMKEKDTNVVVLHWDWVKWYPEYEDVAFIENFLNKLNEEDKPYKFIRIGEDSEDTEIIENYADNDDVCYAISYCREIDF